MNDERQRIIPVAPFNHEKRLELAKLLVEAGFSARVGKEKNDGKTVYFVEYWEE
jgi:hypothetical protein